MKKAFDANVSRMKPRVRLGLLTESNGSIVEDIASRVAREAPPIETPSLAEALKAKTHAKRSSAAEALKRAIAPAPTPPLHKDTMQALADDSVNHDSELHARAPMEAPEETTEVHTEATPVDDAPERRERLKERLKAVRENPRPEPLPDTVAEAGMLAVERIGSMQIEVSKVRALNLALTQDLEAARRQAERATEEARSRMDEARRLSNEMATRAELLTELEKELSSLEAERNEALVALQQSRQLTVEREKENAQWQQKFESKVVEVNECLAEEERLADELEKSQAATANLRAGVQALTGERDTLARQVSDLSKERVELLEARKALDAVHRALSSAVVR
jgi:DNA repair exonuclease SbcCD ATPase subunit